MDLLGWPIIDHAVVVKTTLIFAACYQHVFTTAPPEERGSVVMSNFQRRTTPKPGSGGRIVDYA
jgi:hypothetical protein